MKEVRFPVDLSVDAYMISQGFQTQDESVAGS